MPPVETHDDPARRELRRRGLTLGFPTGSLSVAHDFDPAGRLQTVAAGTYSARYSYLANSPLVDTVSFKQGTATVMTTTRTHDNLNRLTSVHSAGSGSTPPLAFTYGYNDANQRVRATLADGSYWIYDYDALGQVISGKHFWADGTPVAGEQFEYGLDDIGNRRTTKAGGDSSGGSLRSASYTSDSLNRYANRDVPGAVDVLGTAVTGASVSVNGVTVTSGRKGEYYQQTVPVGNSAAAQWVGVTVVATQNGQTETQNGNVFVPKTREVFGCDDDGNLTQDGRWRYTWDAENRLVRIEPATAVGPQLTLTFTYDALGRRIRKTVTGGGSAVEQRFAYDGWNLVAILSSDLRPLSSFVWGLDLSGTEPGAGGVGGLLAVLDVAGGAISGASYPAYDGNGNVVGLLNAANGTWVAQYEYGPFGEPIRRTAPKAAANSFRFSTKYTDDETDLLYYGYRYYHPSLGRWLSRDPIEEEGGVNLCAFGGNAPLDYIDPFGERAVSFEINGPQTPLGFSFFLRVAATATTCPVEVDASVFGALEWQPPGLRYLKKPFGWFNVHVEFGARGGIQGKVKYSECSSLSETKVCGRFEIFGRAEYRRPRFRGPDGRFTRLRFGAGADGGVELCLNFCNGEVTVDGTFSWYGYVHVGWRDFNRSYNVGDGYSGHWSLGTFPQAAFLKDYCNKAPDPNNCCCIKRYGGATTAH